MSKTAIIYWSGTGNTESMATAILEGAKEVNPDTKFFAVSEISAADAASYDTLILGCPAMGAEVLEEGEFEPFFAELEPNLSGKNVALFGSYGWGDGEWMRNWVARMEEAGAQVYGGEDAICMNEPDSEAEEKLEALGKELAAL